MVSTGKFLLQLLQTKVAPINWVNTWDLVDFKFGIDCQKMKQICNFMDFSHKADRPKHWGPKILKIFMLEH